MISDNQEANQQDRFLLGFTKDFDSTQFEHSFKKKAVLCFLTSLSIRRLTWFLRK